MLVITHRTMDERLKVAAETGDVDSLYSLINEDVYILERLDKIPFVNTPLHIAASAGNLHFCMEMLRLMPSYARKLNPDGYSPIHLALENGQIQLLLRLIDVDRDLIQVQGKEGKSVLHCAAELGMADLVAEFLYNCPKSIQVLTIRKETALHVAVKNHQLEVVKVLTRWLEHVGKDEVLNWADDEGNNILHIAAYRSEIEMLKLIMGRPIDINAKNLACVTALDMIKDQSSTNQVRRMLICGGALKAAAVGKVPTLVESLKQKMSLREKWIIADYRKKLYLSNETFGCFVCNIQLPSST